MTGPAVRAATIVGMIAMVVAGAAGCGTQESQTGQVEKAETPSTARGAAPGQGELTLTGLGELTLGTQAADAIRIRPRLEPDLDPATAPSCKWIADGENGGPGHRLGFAKPGGHLTRIAVVDGGTRDLPLREPTVAQVREAYPDADVETVEATGSEPGLVVVHPADRRSVLVYTATSLEPDSALSEDDHLSDPELRVPDLARDRTGGCIPG